MTAHQVMHAAGKPVFHVFTAPPMDLAGGKAYLHEWFSPCELTPPYRVGVGSTELVIQELSIAMDIIARDVPARSLLDSGGGLVSLHGKACRQGSPLRLRIVNTGLYDLYCMPHVLACRGWEGADIEEPSVNPECNLCTRFDVPCGRDDCPV